MVTTGPFFHRPVNKIFPADAKLKKNPTILMVVAAALVAKDGRILLQKRPEGRDMAGLWEFPGGKLEEGELPEEALSRELAEELSIQVKPEKLAPACFASAPLSAKHLVLLLYICRDWQGEVAPTEAQEVGWFTVSEMRRLQMPPADLPLIELLDKLLPA